MEPCNHLITILDAYIDAFGGRMRARGIKTALLIAQASAEGHGISVSDLARQTDAPPETVRRHITKHAEAGRLHFVSDPDDDRVAKVMARRDTALTDQARELTRRLGNLHAGAPVPLLEAVPFSELIAVIEAFISRFPGEMKIRGFKTALLVQRATLSGTGIGLSEISRQTRAPLENVRRHMARYESMGAIRYAQDPDDNRATRVMFRSPDLVGTMVREVSERLSTIDWTRFREPG